MFKYVPINNWISDNILRIRILTIISALSLLISQLVIYYSTKYYLLIIAYFIYGFAMSITLLPTIRNCWKYNSNKKRLISGILYSSCGLSTFFIHKHRRLYNKSKCRKSEIDKDLYSKDVAMKYTKYLKLFII